MARSLTSTRLFQIATDVPHQVFLVGPRLRASRSGLPILIYLSTEQQMCYTTRSEPELHGHSLPHSRCLPIGWCNNRPLPNDILMKGQLLEQKKKRFHTIDCSSPTSGPPSGEAATGRTCTWLRTAAEGKVVRRALVYAVVVGAILVAINHGDAVLTGHVDASRWVRIVLTVMVPYCVSTASNVGAILELRPSENAVDDGATMSSRLD